MNDKDIDKSVKTTEPMRYIGTEGLTNDKVVMNFKSFKSFKSLNKVEMT